MLKIKEGINLKQLEKFGFKIEYEKQYYYINTSEAEIFIWIVKGYDYKPRHLYIETKANERIVSEIGVVYDLIKADIVEKV